MTDSANRIVEDRLDERHFLDRLINRAALGPDNTPRFVAALNAVEFAREIEISAPGWIVASTQFKHEMVQPGVVQDGKSGNLARDAKDSGVKARIVAEVIDIQGFEKRAVER